MVVVSIKVEVVKHILRQIVTVSGQIQTSTDAIIRNALTSSYRENVELAVVQVKEKITD